MDVLKYRKWYLSQNWGENRFSMIIKCVETHRREHVYTIDLQRNHPLVLSGNAYWITHNQLCIGYELDGNSDVFRPIFSHKRQRLLDLLMPSIGESVKFCNKGQSRLRTKYFNYLYKIKILPVSCIENIIMLIC
jgi:hypothetical protein